MEITQVEKELLSTISDLRKKVADLTNTKELTSLSSFSFKDVGDNKLEITGILLAEGEWGGVHYPAEEIKRMVKTYSAKLKNMNLTAEHEKTYLWGGLPYGKHTDVFYNPDLKAAIYKAVVNKNSAIDAIKGGTFRATSMRLKHLSTFDENGKKTATDIEPVNNTLTQFPACKNCKIFHWKELSEDGLEYYGVKDLSETHVCDNNTFEDISELSMDNYKLSKTDKGFCVEELSAETVEDSIKCFDAVDLALKYMMDSQANIELNNDELNDSVEMKNMSDDTPQTSGQPTKPVTPKNSVNQQGQAISTATTPAPNIPTDVTTSTDAVTGTTTINVPVPTAQGGTITPIVAPTPAPTVAPAPVAVQPTAVAQAVDKLVSDPNKITIQIQPIIQAPVAAPTQAPVQVPETSTVNEPTPAPAPASAPPVQEPPRVVTPNDVTHLKNPLQAAAVLIMREKKDEYGRRR